MSETKQKSVREEFADKFISILESEKPLERGSGVGQHRNEQAL